MWAGLKWGKRREWQPNLQQKEATPSLIGERHTEFYLLSKTAKFGKFGEEKKMFIFVCVDGGAVK